MAKRSSLLLLPDPGFSFKALLLEIQHEFRMARPLDGVFFRLVEDFRMDIVAALPF